MYTHMRSTLVRSTPVKFVLEKILTKCFAIQRKHYTLVRNLKITCHFKALVQLFFDFGILINCIWHDENKFNRNYY